MNYFLNGVVRAIAETFDLPGPVLEVGSYQVEGQEAIGNLRGYFRDREYVGLDQRAGPGVDQVGDVTRLPFADASFGTVLALNTFEHVERFWRGFDEVRRVLRPDGALIVSCPFYFKVHNYPADYWRFTPAALQSLLEPYPSKILGWHGAKNRPLHVWAIAFRESRPSITEAKFERYRSLLQQYAREPESTWTRRLRYLLASMVCGRGPFSPYLDRNRWETQCFNTPIRAYRVKAPANLENIEPFVRQ